MAHLASGKVVAAAYGILSTALLVLLISAPYMAAEEESITHPSEVTALLAVKEKLSDPMGYMKAWGKGDPCNSEWPALECYNATGSDGYMHVQALYMLTMNLSGTLAPELGQLSQLEILDFMWNHISGSIPREIGNISTLKLLLLNGNQLSGSLPSEIGLLSKLDRLQVDENYISGPIPSSFMNLKALKHLHMNNNSISGAIPPEICTLPILLHFLVDNNNLSGVLPPEFSNSESLLILQLDNNNFSGSSIPDSYRNITSLVKMSFRNCSLRGTIPDFSMISNLTYLDLSWNQLEGSIPANRLSKNITTIDFSNNNLNGSIPANFSKLPVLQKLSLKNNQLSGSIPFVWENLKLPANGSLLLDFQNNELLEIFYPFNTPPNVTIMLRGNPICKNENAPVLLKYCGSETKEATISTVDTSFSSACPPQSCPEKQYFEYIPASPIPCYCAAPIRIGYRLKSPGFTDFLTYKELFQEYLSHDIHLVRYQLYIDSFIWEHGPRLRMYLKLFPNTDTDHSVFNKSEVRRIRDLFAGWKIHNRDIIGPYELLNVTLLGPYSPMKFDSPSHLKKRLIEIISGILAVSVILSVVISVIIRRRRLNNQNLASRRHSLSLSGVKVDGVKQFRFKEMIQATDDFSDNAQVGQGGYGKVYKGVLSDGTVVAVKRAQEDSLQGAKEFCNEIQFLSRLHHRNLVSLVGYCDEESEQMLIYEFMQNGTLRDQLSSKSKRTLDFPKRLRIALGAAKGILYLHTEANPPIIHRDIKASNILLDSKLIAKVADFGLSRLAPEPNDDGLVNGHVSTVVKGTPGYLDPEYFLTRKLTDKCDVYSLGVVFLELLTGMQPISQGKNIVREVTIAHQQGRTPSIIDRRLGSYSLDCALKFATLALRCCDDNTDIRPSIAQVVYELEAIWLMIPGVDIAVSESMVTDSSSHSQPVSGDLYSPSSRSESYSQSVGISILHPR